MDFYLSSKLLKQISKSGIDDDFRIMIFEKTIKCSTFVAIFLSKKIMKLFLNDRTTRQFFVNFPSKSFFYSNIDELKQKMQQTDFIFEINNLINGDPIHFDQCKANEENSKNVEKAQLLIEFGKIIENDEMIEKGLETIKMDLKSDMTLSEAFKQIQIQQFIGYENNCEKEFEFISSNLYKIFNSKEKNDEYLTKLKEMTNDELEKIFTSDKLQIENEDSLFEMIKELGNDYYYLFDYIEFQFLSIEKVKELIEIINRYDISISGSLWSSICRRLIIDVSRVNKDKNIRSISKQSLPIKCESGIFKYLQNSTENHEILKLIDVEISGSTSGEIKNLFDWSKDTHIRICNSQNAKYGTITFDFKSMNVNINKYYFSVPSAKNNNYSNRPRTWTVEGSTNKKNWTLIDEKNDKSLNDFSKSNSFDCQSNKDFYRFIRIQSIVDSNESSDHRFLLSELEFYGNLLQNNS